MTHPQCPHCLAEIARLDGELAKARMELAEAREASGIIKWADDTRLSIKFADERDAFREMYESAEGSVKRTLAERDEARADVEIMKDGYASAAGERNRLLAEVSRLKAGLVAMHLTLVRFADTDHNAMDENECLDHADITLASIGTAIDALIGKEPA